jgi:hypothetical protein
MDRKIFNDAVSTTTVNLTSICMRVLLSSVNSKGLRRKLSWPILR